MSGFLHELFLKQSKMGKFDSKYNGENIAQTDHTNWRKKTTVQNDIKVY